MSKPILIHAASHKDAERLISTMLNTCMTTVGGWNFYDGKFGGVSVIVYESGEGMVNAAAATTLAVAYFGPGALITQGTAKPVAGEAKHGDLLIATAAINAGAPDGEVSVAQSGVLLKQRELKAEERLAEVTGRAPFEGTTLTGTIVSADSEISAELAEAYNAQVADSESAAIFQIAQSFGVPCIGAKLVYDHDDNAALDGYAKYVYTLARRVARAGYGIDVNVKDLFSGLTGEGKAEE